MVLKELIKGLKVIKTSGDTNVVIASVTSDSRKVKHGSLFVAIRGIEHDGNDYVEMAIEKGAVAVICDREPAVRPEDAVMITVEKGRDALSLVASRFYGDPSKDLSIIGITGTNGKTTTSYLVREIFSKWGKKTGMIGTISYFIGDRKVEADFTTPEAEIFQKLLHEMKNEGCEYVISEVSSHALVQGRVDHTVFSRAVFTNLSRDHLDFHKDMDSYFDAKSRLFTDLLADSGVAILNADDPKLLGLKDALSTAVITYGIHEPADLMADSIEKGLNGTSFDVLYRGHKHRITSSLLGTPNVYNILAAIAVSISLGVPMDVVIGALEDVKNIEGRFETFYSDEGVLFVLDYAHTPDALEKLIGTALELPHRKIITVFGCGGDRDRGKRPIMGRIASDNSDIVITTSDNPRYEDPEKIIDDIIAGIDGKYISIVEREKAIEEAVKIAKDGDVVLIAGKGHEGYQEVRGVRYPMNDREILLNAIKEYGSN